MSDTNVRDSLGTIATATDAIDAAAKEIDGPSSSLEVIWDELASINAALQEIREALGLQS